MTAQLSGANSDAADDDVLDPWQLVGLPGGLRLASYLTAGMGTAGQYRLRAAGALD